MKSITFQIHYQTEWGQQLAVSGSIEELGGGESTKSFPMQYVENGLWQATLQLDEVPKVLNYKYLLLDDQYNILKQESGEFRELPLGEFNHITLTDAWRINQHAENSLLTSAFTSAVFQPKGVKTRNIVQKGDELLLKFNMR